MISGQPNYRPALDAAGACCLHFGSLWRRASEAGRSVQAIGYISCLLCAVLCGCANPRGSAYSAVPTAQTSDATDGTVNLPSSFRRVRAMRVRWDDEESKRWQGGCHRLSIYDSNMNEITSEVFRCHYGMTVDAVDLDGDSVPEFVAFLHVGPATGPSIKELRIIRLNGSFLEEIAHVPLAGQAGPSQGWWYNVIYEKDRCRRVTVLMRLQHDPLGEWATFLPRTRFYRITVRRQEADVQSEAAKAPSAAGKAGLRLAVCPGSLARPA
jgi:hypothetical protein